MFAKLLGREMLHMERVMDVMVTHVDEDVEVIVLLRFEIKLVANTLVTP